MNLRSVGSQSGQAVIESVLLIFVIVSLVMLVKNGLGSKEVVKKIFYSPWNNIAGMAENGVWGSANENRSLHPGTFRRVRSNRTDD